MALSDKIRKAMGSCGVNAFSKKAGIDAGNLSRILKGQQPSAAVIKKIAEASDEVTAEELFYEAGYTSEKRSVYIYGTVSGGLPINAYEEALGEIVLDDSLKGSSEDYFALKVSGDSMDAAYIPDKCTIIVKKQSVIKDGEIGVFLVGDDATVKEFRKKDGKVLLLPRSMNSAHEVQVYDEAADIKILGIVKKAVIDI